MSAIATVLLPFFGVIAIGYGVAKHLGITNDGVAALSTFVFYLALPALFFRVVAETPIAALANLSFVFGTTFATYCAFAIAFSFAALVNRGNVSEATTEGLVGSYGNIAYLAPGLVIATLGSAAGAPVALIFTFDSVMLFTLVPLMMALGSTEQLDRPHLAKAIVQRIFLHPLIVATFAGFAASAVNLQIPAPVNGIVALLAAAAAPSALFLVGVTISGKKPTRFGAEMPVLLAIKLLVHPLIVYLLLGWIGGFDRVWVYAAVLVAALPPAANVAVIARRYGAYVERSASAVLTGLVSSLLTLAGVLWVILDDTLSLTPFD